MNIQRAFSRGLLPLVAALGFMTAASPVAAWEPTKSVEFIIPAGTGGGADQMARLIQGIVAKHNLMKQALIPVNKSGGAGAEGFLELKAAKGDPHKIIITLSNLFTTPMATGVPFNWKDLTPVAMLSLDNFVLWVNAEDPYKTSKEYLDAVKKGGPNSFKMGGTGSKQEDQIITVAIEKAAGVKFTYIPFKGGGQVIVDLVAGQIQLAFLNPLGARPHISAGRVRGIAVTTRKRAQAFPNLPAIAETLPGFHVSNWYGLVAPARTPPQVIDLLYQNVVAILGDADLRDRLEKEGSELLGSAPKEFGAHIINEVQMWGKVIREAGMQAN